MDIRKKIWHALDVPTLSEAVNNAKQLSRYVGTFKVGMELCNAVGTPTVVKELAPYGDIFVDEKFEDIEETMRKVSGVIARNGAAYFNVHASSPMKSLKAVNEAKGNCKVLAVTVLTNFDDADCIAVYGTDVKTTVRRFALRAGEAGCDGFICSPKEIPIITSEPSLANKLIVTPAIRPAWSVANDQEKSRITTPYDAIWSGATGIVVGRPLSAPPSSVGSMVHAAELIYDEVVSAWAKQILTQYAYIKGHFVLQSGRHSAGYVDKDVIYAYPKLLSDFAQAMAIRIMDLNIDTVVGPAYGAIGFANYVAFHLSLLTGRTVNAGFLAKGKGGDGFELRAAFLPHVIGGKRVFVTEDIFTSGASAKQSVELVRSEGGTVVGVGSLLDRGGITAETLGVPWVHALASASADELPSAAPEACGQCSAGVPVTLDRGHGKKFLEEQRSRRATEQAAQEKLAGAQTIDIGA